MRRDMDLIKEDISFLSKNKIVAVISPFLSFAATPKIRFITTSAYATKRAT